MRGNPTVAVVITCYNQGRFLRTAIDSVLEQTYPNLELMVVDDGSTDDTGLVARAYGQKNVQYAYQENQGVSAGRNLGIRKCQAEYLTFLDADDRLLPESIAAGLECMRENPSSGFVFGRYRKIDADGSLIGVQNRNTGAGNYYIALLQGNVVGMHATVLYRKAVLEGLCGFDPQFRGSEDYDILLRIAREFKVAEHDNLVAEYRWHDRNMSWDFQFMLRDTLHALRAQWAYARKNPEYRRAYRIGVNNWRKYYGNLMLADLRKYVKTHGANVEASRRILSVALCYPQSIRILAQEGFAKLSRL